MGFVHMLCDLGVGDLYIYTWVLDLFFLGFSFVRDFFAKRQNVPSYLVIRYSPSPSGLIHRVFIHARRVTGVG